MNVKEQYWKYSLVTIIVVLGTILFVEFIPFLGGILGACTIYILVRKQMLYLTEKKHLRRSFVAVILLLETILCFLIPLSLAVWLFINKLQNFNLDPTQLVKSAEHIANLIEQRTGYDVLDTEDRAGVDGRNQRFRHQCGRTGADTLFHADWWCQDGKVCLQHFAF